MVTKLLPKACVFHLFGAVQSLAIVRHCILSDLRCFGGLSKVAGSRSKLQ